MVRIASKLVRSGSAVRLIVLNQTRTFTKHLLGYEKCELILSRLSTKEKGSRLDVAANSSGLNHRLRVNPKVKIYAPAETFGVFGSTLPKRLSVLLIPPLLTRSRSMHKQLARSRTEAS